MYIIEDRGFLIIEPPFYQDLKWDMKKIMGCLEVLRQKLPSKFKEFPSSLNYYLVRYGDFLGNHYPAIGIFSSSKTDLEKVPDFIELYDIVEEWVNKIGLDNILLEAQNKKVITWEELNKIGYAQ